MCGIWGVIGKCSQFPIEQLFKMFQSTWMRGPESSDFHRLTDVIPMLLGFHRLSIIDPTHRGDQPFTIVDGERAVYSLCNGEIFDYRELIKTHELEPTSQSDCEVIPLLYRKYGIEKTLQLLRGSEFACLIVDLDRSCDTAKVYAARDPLGIRPLFWAQEKDCLAFCSEAKGLIDPEYWRDTDRPREYSGTFTRVTQFPPGEYLEAEFHSTGWNSSLKRYYEFPRVGSLPLSLDAALEAIRTVLTSAVVRRLVSDRPLGCLLSGGLDSSLVAALAARELKKFDRVLRTFSIGMPGATDEKYARWVAEKIGSDHTHFELSEDDFYSALREVVRICETDDLTTIRATTGQYLIAKKIAETTDVKVLLCGDGSDELCSGYIYFHKAPSPEESDLENRRLLSEIHWYDVLRADRGVADNGLEARVPFLDSQFVDLVLALEPELRVPRDGIEKWLLRKAFDGLDLLPDAVLWRRKEAFSDGVSGTEKSWHKVIQERMRITKLKQVLTDRRRTEIEAQPGYEIEAEFYRQWFHEMFGRIDRIEVPRYSGVDDAYYEQLEHDEEVRQESRGEQRFVTVLEKKTGWLPRWCGEQSDPSARELEVYDG